MRMWAAVCDRYGSPEVVQVKQVARPAPGKGEVLVHVHAATVSAGDWRVRAFDVPPDFRIPARLVIGLFRPRTSILGNDFAGVVEQVGAGVTQFAPGDRVCGAGSRTHAEFTKVKASGAIVKIPDGGSFEDYATLAFGPGTARHFYKLGKVRTGDSVLVNGATGAVGAAAVQLARQAGAQVTAVCSAANADFARGLGADRVIDYAHEDFAIGDARFDVIIDTVGNAPYKRCAAILKPGGRLLHVSGGLGTLMGTPAAAKRAGHQTFGGVAQPTHDDMAFLADLMAQGDLKPVIEQVYPLKDIVAAHRRVESRRKRGNIIVTMDA